MARNRDDSLSELARQLLADERRIVEPELLKARALARARMAVESTRLSGTESQSRFGWGPWRRVSRLPRVAVPAAALAIAGLAAAAVGILMDPSPNEGAPAVIVSRPSSSTQARPAVRIPAPEVAPASPPLTPLTPLTPPSAGSGRSSSTTNAPRGAASTKPGDAASRAGSARQYALELEVLEPARQAIARGNYGAALEAAARHERSFPNGQLAEERSALRVRALWASGRRTEAWAAAAVFGRRYPRSGLLAWMRDAAAPSP